METEIGERPHYVNVQTNGNPTQARRAKHEYASLVA
jgi:hypothetical protein